MLSTTALNPTARLRRACILAVPALLAWPIVTGGAAQAATPFSIANIFFELNSTAGDLGVHVSLDGESWKILRVQDPQGREIVELEPKRGAKTIGLTELFFEGSEPPLVDVSFARFLELFPQGNYRFLGVTTGNQLLRSTDPLTPELPCPVKVVSPPPDKPVAPDQVVIRWEPAPGVFNPDSGICKKNQDVELASYEVIAEVVNEEAGLVRHYTVELAAGVTELPVPRTFFKEGLLLPGTEFRLEVIAIEDTGNKTITEGTFQVSSH